MKLQAWAFFNFTKYRTSLPMFSNEVYKIFQYSYSTDHLRTAPCFFLNSFIPLCNFSETITEASISLSFISCHWSFSIPPENIKKTSGFLMMTWGTERAQWHKMSENHFLRHCKKKWKKQTLSPVFLQLHWMRCMLLKKKNCDSFESICLYL